MAKRRKRPTRVPTVRSRPEAPRRAEPPKPRQAPVAEDAGPGESGSRFAPVRRRAAQAKLALATAALAAFVIGLLVTRTSYAGHSKRPLHALAAPPGFVQIVRRNLLQAGIIAPAQAPPGASTAVS
jgi:hypothetical protein